MSQSAIADRRAATAARLTSTSRRWTAERGLSGFTIEELCDEVGISRRTFFNYFPSKDEAVLGVDEGEEVERLAGTFLALESRGWPAVLEDLVLLAGDMSEQLGITLDTHTEFIGALEREPRLLARALGMNREREQQLAELVASREGVATNDPRVRATIALFATLMRSSVESLLEAGNADLRAALETSLAALLDVLATPNDRKDQ
jgi:AcrR family transcriptional regulator